MCWLAAPAGYGKTTAAVDFLQDSESPHVWYRVDDEDQDVARLFHYLAMSPGMQKFSLPVFGTEYADNPAGFARLFFRAYFSRLEPTTVIVLDDLHRADSPEFREVLAVLLQELPNTIRCICISRTLPKDAVAELALAGRLPVIGQTTLEFSDREARSLVSLRNPGEDTRSIDVTAAQGWAVGLIMLANPGAAFQPMNTAQLEHGRLNEAVGRLFMQNVPGEDLDALLKLNLLPEISPGLADALLGSGIAGPVLERLYQRQLLVTRIGPEGTGFQFHDLLRDYLTRLLEERLSARQQASLREMAARVLRWADKPDDAISLSLQAEAWSLAREIILERAEAVLSHGRRATLIEWCTKLPPEERDGWVLHWIGAAHVPDDAAAERWFSKAWDSL